MLLIWWRDKKDVKMTMTWWKCRKKWFCGTAPRNHFLLLFLYRPVRYNLCHRCLVPHRAVRTADSGTAYRWLIPSYERHQYVAFNSPTLFLLSHLYWMFTTSSRAGGANQNLLHICINKSTAICIRTSIRIFDFLFAIWNPSSMILSSLFRK